MLAEYFIPPSLTAVVTAKHTMKIIKRAKQTDVQKLQQLNVSPVTCAVCSVYT